MQRLVLCFAWVFFLPEATHAHPSDVSQMRVRVEHDRVEFRLTLNLLTLSRIAVVDASHDRRISADEVASAAPAISKWLKEKVLVTINDSDAGLGDFKGHECVWPNSTTAEVTDQEASQRYVDFNFSKPWPAGVRELWIGFQIFAQVGDQHVVQAIYQQKGNPDLPVDFTQFEPEYLYDTGWSVQENTTPASMEASYPQPEWSSGWLALVAGAILLGATVGGWLHAGRSKEKQPQV